jgi:hypothetical protein
MAHSIRVYIQSLTIVVYRNNPVKNKELVRTYTQTGIKNVLLILNTTEHKTESRCCTSNSMSARSSGSGTSGSYRTHSSP